MRTLRELRDELNDEQIKNILGQFNVEPHFETEEAIIFPTCCHNLEGGSPKLYYYKNTKLFKCYTQCNDIFDIFTLLIKMYKLRGKDITIRQAVEVCELDNQQDVDYDYSSLDDLKYLQELNNTVSIGTIAPLKIYDKKIMNRYVFSLGGVAQWIDEGIPVEQLQKFNIKYDPLQNCIVIPNYDIDGNLVGVRGRFLEPDAKAKYAPLWYNKVCLSHPTGRNFYGIYENKDAIMKKKTVVIFEGEKSVMKYGAYYKDNIALATLGKTVTKSHILLLQQLGVKRVVLAYDADYESEAQFLEKREEYIKIAKILTPYFNVSILLDYDMRLNYKDSPIDQGKDYFEKLIKERLTL